MYIAAANADQLWDEDDGFYYDLLRRPDGSCVPMRVRSLVGLIPLFAVALLTSEMMDRLPAFMARMRWFNNQHPELTKNVHNWEEPGVAGRRLLKHFQPTAGRARFARVLDENEFLSAHGIRSVSRYDKDHPYTYWVSGQAYQVDYEPAESTTGLFGGNSNWRGPVWMPINALIIEGLLVRYLYAGDQVKLECPTGSGNKMTLLEIAGELGRRLARPFLRAEDTAGSIPAGHRPVYGGTTRFQTDPHWRDLILFYEYFHGDNGAGIGASHQTGWTGLVVRPINFYGELMAGREWTGHGWLAAEGQRVTLKSREMARP